MDLKACIPSNKHDSAAVERALQVGFPALEPVLLDLLIWLQDMNWPVAGPLCPLLAQAGPALLPHLRDILRSNDDVWKYWIISRLLTEVPLQVIEQLRPDLQRIVNAPTPGEELEDLPELASVALVRNVRSVSD
jgi:hypothetical protein